MKKLIKSSPGGFNDLLFNQCVQRREIEGELRELFRLRGYHEVITPALEYYDIFSFTDLPLETMYKLTDLSGRLLIMRPDTTVPIARVITTHLKDASLPIRLFYNQNVFRMTEHLSGQKNEIAQSGIELIGAKGIKADLEVLLCAINAMSILQKPGGGSFRFEIGHVDFFKSLIAKLPLTPVQCDEVNGLIRAKNYARLNDALSGYSHMSAAAGLMRLPRLFGGYEVLDEIKKFSDDPVIMETIKYLERIYEFIKELSGVDNIIIDLGLMPENAYYTGIVFRGYKDGIGAPVLSGGRYDKLYTEFHMDSPAIGFAIYIDEALKSAGKENHIKISIVHIDQGFETKAYRFCDDLRAEGIPCTISCFDVLDESAAYAKALRADNLIAVGREIKYIIKDGKYEEN